MNVPNNILTQFTFTLWLKSEIGSLEYPLLFYLDNSTTTAAIDISFTSPDIASPVYQMNVQIMETFARYV